MTTKTKLWIGFGTLIAILLSIVVPVAFWLRALESQVERLTTVAEPTADAVRTMQADVSGAAAAVSNYLHLPDPTRRRRIEDHLAGFKTHLADYQRLAEAPERREFGRRIGSLFDRYEALARRLIAQRDADTPQPRGFQSFLDLRDQLNDLLDQESRNLAAREVQPEREQVRASAGALLAASVALLVAGLLAAVISSAVVGRAVVKTEDTLRVTMASIGDAVVTTDDRGRVTYLNTVAESITGWSNAEAAGQPLDRVFRIVDEQSREPIESPVRQVLREGAVVARTDHTLLIAKDGAERPIDHSAAPIRGERGGLRGVVVTFRDIAQRKESEAALAEQVRLLTLEAEVGVALTQGENLREMLQGCTEALVRSVDAAFARIWTFNPRENVLELQASAGMYTHIDGGHARVPMGKFKIGMIAQERKPHLTNSVIGDPRVPEQEWAKREGLVAFAGYPLLVDGRLMGVMAMFARRPLTERALKAMASIANEVALGVRRKRAEDELLQANETLEERVEQRTAQLAEVNEALQRSNRELEQFASVASHDLQEPLRKIQAFGDRLHAKYYDVLDETGRGYVERMQAAAGRMRRLIDDLLTFSRVTTKAQPFEPVDLNEVATEVVSDLETRLEQTGGRVEIGELPTLDADRMQMRQLLQNLIGNGLKFHREGVPPVVQVNSRLLEDWERELQVGNGSADPAATQPQTAVELTVRDNGIGFDETYLDRIFEVFQRLHGRLEYEGTGMGLAICRKIVERHGGVITARSAPDEGAAFVITLPLHQNHAPSDSDPTDPGQSTHNEAPHDGSQSR